MDLCALVRMTVYYNQSVVMIHYLQLRRSFKNVFNFILDIDECSSSPGVCHSNASCANNNGSFQCDCLEGFFGNGFICEGIIIVEFLKSSP